MKAPTSLRDLMEGAESLVYVEDLSEKKGFMQAINPLAKLVAIVAMIVASLLITNLSVLLAICIIPLFFVLTSHIPLKHYLVRTAFATALAAVISVWNKTYGGIYYDIFRDIVKTTSGFAITGEMSPEEGISNCVWLVNVNTTGDVIWSRIYKGNTISLGSCLVTTPDKGFVIVGTVRIINTSVNALLLIRVDSYGNERWNQTYMGDRYGEGNYIVQTPHGYALTGAGSVYKGNFSTTNFWLILTDINGRINYNLTMCTVSQGTISPGNQTYMSGTKVNLFAVPADGWTFSGWSRDASGADNTTITMDSDKTVTATFTQTPYNLTIITVGSGSVYPGNQSYTRGTNISLSAVNAAGWSFSGWSGDASETANTTITMNTNKMITATFTQDSTSTPTPTATATPSPTSSSSPVSTPTSTPASTSQASPSPSMSASRSPTPSPPTVTQNPAPSVPELSSIILVPAILSAIIAMVIKRSQRK